MRQFDFYEFTGILAPGTVLLAGLAILFPTITKALVGDDFSAGELGLFVILAYAAGHLLQALGNLLEWLWWKAWQGWPTDWLRTGQGDVLNQKQRELLADRVRLLLRLGPQDDPWSSDAKQWAPVVRQVDAAVQAAGRSARVVTFNGNYGLLRGIAAALLALSGAVLGQRGPSEGCIAALILLALAAVALYRMHRFARHYARELFVQFLQIAATSKEATNEP